MGGVGTNGMTRRIRMGMVGGGEGAFIGAVHRMAAALDGRIELVCGAFSSDPERARRSGAALGLAAARSYPSYPAMMAGEGALPASERMEFVAIVTPNHLHLPVALCAIEHGFHVLSDKPATLSLEECRRLREALEGKPLHYGLTHTYSGYPMVREARARVLGGELGALRKIVVDYSQGWLAGAEEDAGNKQARWRLDPAFSGTSACMGDIGVHAAQLAEFVCGQAITEVCAELNTFGPGRLLDDDGSVFLHFSGGARGLLHASQICCGEENNLSLRVYGEQGGLVWRQEEPNTLWLLRPDEPRQRLRAGGPGLLTVGQWTRLPAGHPEGYLEAFANLYGEFADRVGGRAQGDCLPGIGAALRGMAFIEAVVVSSRAGQRWVPLFNEGVV